MTNNQAIELDSLYMAETYGRFPIAFSKGKNATAYDLDGKKYIDLTSGIGVNSLGIADDEWVKAVTSQVSDIAHICNYFVSPQTVALAEKLVKLSGMKRVFMANSGGEANEGAIKTARKYSHDKYGEQRSTIVSLCNSFHGRTVTTLAATGQDSFHTHFGPFTEGFKYSPLNDLKALEEALTPDVCAVIAEPVQGEGGVFPMSEEFAEGMRDLCDKNDILIIFDEVQCGIGRTGKLFAFENFKNVKPDIMTLAKGLGGGLPIGAFMLGEKCEHTLGHGQHGSTFGGNPVSAAGANVVIDRITSAGFLDSVVKKGEYIRKKIAAMDIPYAAEIRGRGMMLGIAVDSDSGKKAAVFSKKAAENGLLVLTAGGNTIRLLPPLTITYDELDEAMAQYKKTAKDL
ncbi:MAG: aspartate aminotransferase family protein [Clostridiales bacterium]|nr:aspartate aminotransferase family protein [Clostridiales bacterium]